MAEATGEASDALAALAAALGREASTDDLERALPLVARVLDNALRTEPPIDLGETEPAFGLQFAASSGAEGDDDGSS